MRAVILAGVFLISVSCMAESLNPSEVEASFTNGLQSLPAIVAQEQYQRRLADIYLGLFVSSNFASYGQLYTERFRVLESLPVYGPQNAPPGFVQTIVERDDAEGEDDSDEVGNDEEDESESDTVSLLELKEDFTPFYGGAGYAQQAPAGPTTTMSLDEINKACHATKVSALRGLQIQLYLAGHDVSRSFWTNKLVIALVPPQLSVFKLYKSYLNTLALTLAYQLHDVFTMETFMEDFNRNGMFMSPKTEKIEAFAEHELFAKWQYLALIKWSLLLLNTYESYASAQLVQPVPAPAPAPAAAPATPSFVEVDSKFVGADPATAFITSYTYLSYYSMILKYFSLYSEISLAQVGSMNAMLKMKVLTDKDVEMNTLNQLKDLEHKTLPALFHQWGSVNQMKFYAEYMLFMFDLYNPQLAAVRAAERAENTFQNLVQTTATTATAEAPRN